VVSGTANLIAVSGTTDAGYAISIDPAFQARMTTLESNAATVSNAITAETGRAVTAETMLNANLATNVATIVNAVAMVNANVATNVTTLLADVDRVNSNAASNMTTLLSNIGLVNANLVANTATLTTRIATVQSNVAAVEASVGLSATGSYVVPIGSTYLANTVNVMNALAVLDSAFATTASDTVTVTVERNRAEAAEANIAGWLVSNASFLAANIALTRANLAVIDNSVGLSTTGSYVVPVGSTYLGNTVSVMMALAALDAAVAGVSEANAITAEMNRAVLAEANVAGNVATLVNKISTTDANVAGEITRAEGAESALLANVSAIQSSYVKKDGSVPFTANVSMGGFHVQNIADPVASGDAVNLATLTRQINSLSSIFTYVGTITVAGADSATAGSLSGLTGTGPAGALTVGDYWKVTVSGWLTDGTTPFFVQANDGIVYNTTHGWDVIAHVDSVVHGTSNLVAVSGSVDTGYSVTIDPVFQGRIGTLEANVVTLTGNISSEVGRAVAAETTLNANVVGEISRAANAEGTIAGNVAVEIARATGAEGNIAGWLITNVTALSTNIATVQSNVTTEVARATAAEANVAGWLISNVTALGVNIATVQGNVAVEIARAKAAEANVAGWLTDNVSVLVANIATVQSNLAASINTVQANVVANASTLTTAIGTVSANVVANIATVTTTINQVQANVSGNVATLCGAMATINANTMVIANTVTAIETAVGLSNTGSFVAFANTTYLGNASSIGGALRVLDQVANAASLVSAPVITLSGDVSGVGSNAITTILANSGVIAGTYGSNTAIPVLHIDNKGRITSVTTVPPGGGGGGLTSVTLTGDVTGTSNATGTIATTVDAGIARKYQFLVNITSGNIDATTPYSSLPAGWSASRDTVSQLTVTHNLSRVPTSVIYCGASSANANIYQFKPFSGTIGGAGVSVGIPTATFAGASTFTPAGFTIYGLTAGNLGTQTTTTILMEITI
jgi:hypothetical protein